MLLHPAQPLGDGRMVLAEGKADQLLQLIGGLRAVRDRQRGDRDRRDTDLLGQDPSELHS